jgi:hypothetical protein
MMKRRSSRLNVLGSQGLYATPMPPRSDSSAREASQNRLSSMWWGAERARAASRASSIASWRRWTTTRPANDGAMVGAARGEGREARGERPGGKKGLVGEFESFGSVDVTIGG